MEIPFVDGEEGGDEKYKDQTSHTLQVSILLWL